jgi:hypothetical protein
MAFVTYLILQTPYRPMLNVLFGYDGTDSSSSLIPAKAGIQLLGPRFRGDERMELAHCQYGG